MSVSKIFKVLIVVVGCVIVGALVLNVLLPNVTTSLISTVEGAIYNATGLSMDFNGDGTAGDKAKDAVKFGGGTVDGAGGTVSKDKGVGKDSAVGGGVNGFN